MRKPGPLKKIAKALEQLEQLPKAIGHISSVAREHQINRRTLRDAWHRLQLVRLSKPSPTHQRELERALRHTDGRGSRSGRLLTDLQEESIIAELKEKYPHGFDRAIVRNLCRANTYSLRNKPRLFSNGFITRFLKRAGICAAKFRSVKRPSKDPCLTFQTDLDAALEYISEVEELANSYPRSRIINADETPSWVSVCPATALHFKGTPSPFAFTQTSTREKVTVIGACTSDGTMLRSAIIAKGLTNRCHRGFVSAGIGNCFVQHTKKGASTTRSFKEYISEVIVKHLNNEPGILIVDSYGSHITDEVKLHCIQNKIHLVQVPPRSTEYLQPMDVSVFGPAKFEVMRQAREDCFRHVRMLDDRWRSTTVCIEALADVTRAQVLRGWSEIFPSFG